MRIFPHADLTGADFTGAAMSRARMHRVLEDKTVWRNSTRPLALGTDPDLAEAEDWTRPAPADGKR